MKLFLILSLLFAAAQLKAEDVVYVNPALKQARQSAVQMPESAETVIDNTAVKIKPELPGQNDNTPAGNKPNYNLLTVEDKYQIPKSFGNPDIQNDCDANNEICIISYKYSDQIIVVAENHSPAARTIYMTYNLKNLETSEGSEDQKTVIKQGARRKIETLRPIDINLGYQFEYSYTSYFGVVDALHDNENIYDLPFESGQTWMLWQAYGGNFSHTNKMNYYAYDFKMPEGTNVVAAREGIVIEVEDSFSKGGLEPSLKEQVNHIFIQHEDGTMADYAHIKHNGAMVEVGDYVQKGQKIALSGNTGYSGNPHLHFAVLKTVRDGIPTSIPVKIKTANGVSDNLKAGQYYTK